MCIGCGNRTKQKSCKELYDEYLPKNIERCVQAMVQGGEDAEIADRKCRYSMQRAFEIDSTFVRMDNPERNEFLMKHAQELMGE